jgi:hypothetical protein
MLKLMGLRFCAVPEPFVVALSVCTVLLTALTAIRLSSMSFPPYYRKPNPEVCSIRIVNDAGGKPVTGQLAKLPQEVLLPPCNMSKHPT